MGKCDLEQSTSVYLPDPVRDSLVCGWSGIENRSLRFAISCYSKVDAKYQKMVSQKVSIFPHLISWPGTLKGNWVTMKGSEEILAGILMRQSIWSACFQSICITCAQKVGQICKKCQNGIC